ncbi:protein-arginine deiminase family protein [Pseudorhodoferax sp. Leaf265]|uniref:protein-arginine deiminase family protein n=1 Tax=Pseudorhodoferax sp. Leaf265 TaxID=1736315 RepID=UPI0006FBA63D|nr:protein-arginine deiminase family protein [Pseudorhodoferax sp. Leaf265]KQP12066.1 hypothetical protein ASF45_32185 [Pseudorhodoferax sp. Leaf265]
MHMVTIAPIEGATREIRLGVQRGTVTLRSSDGLQVAGWDAVTGSLLTLRQDEPLAVSKLFDSTILLQTPTGEKGLFNVHLELRVDEPERLDIGVLVAHVHLDCDADRDGAVGLNEEGKANWIWGENGRGAMVLVDNDRDVTSETLDEREPIVVRPLGVDALPPGVSLRLSTAPEAALNMSLLRWRGDTYEKVIGRLPGEAPQQLVTAATVHPSGETLYLAAHAYPGPYFEGLVIFNLELVQEVGAAERVIAADRVMLRVAPWIMTPNTQPAVKIYTTRVAHGKNNNAEFLAGLKAAVEAEKLTLEIIEAGDHRDDRWIQDEIEIGYSQTHRGTIPVVFDSPRDRGLDSYPEAKMLGADFGHFVVGGGVPGSLDSFGNLEVSPPVTVGGKNYPLGRVIVGGRRDNDLAHDSRQMMAEVRQFLYSQRVQFPFELYTDWLAVAHVDEIVCFVPDEAAPKGFRCLLASPAKTKAVLLDLHHGGHGDAILFEGKTRDGADAQCTVTEMLDDAPFWKANEHYQTVMDENRVILERELGLVSADFVQIPVAFRSAARPDGSLRRTLAYFPDMVNHLVVGTTSIVPKPYGPVVDGECAFEKAFKSALPGRRVVFIDDWYSYHEMSGEVHCGTNALRRPFSASKWWSVKPEGGYDIKELKF